MERALVWVVNQPTGEGRLGENGSAGAGNAGLWWNLWEDDKNI